MRAAFRRTGNVFGLLFIFGILAYFIACAATNEFENVNQDFLENINALNLICFLPFFRNACRKPEVAILGIIGTGVLVGTFFCFSREFPHAFREYLRDNGYTPPSRNALLNQFLEWFNRNRNPAIADDESPAAALINPNNNV